MFIAQQQWQNTLNKLGCFKYPFMLLLVLYVMLFGVKKK